MDLFSRLLGDNPESQKSKKFKELEGRYSNEMLAFTKAAWLTNRGVYHAQHRNLRQAVADLSEAITLMPAYVPAHIGLGVAYMHERRFQEALATLARTPSKMTYMGEDYGDAELQILSAMATVYLNMGDKAKAVEYATRAIEVADDPGRLELAKRSEEKLGIRLDAPEQVEAMKRIVQQLEGPRGMSGRKPAQSPREVGIYQCHKGRHVYRSVEPLLQCPDCGDPMTKIGTRIDEGGQAKSVKTVNDDQPEVALLRLFEKAKAGACAVCGQYGHDGKAHREPTDTLATFQWTNATTPADYALWLLDKARDLGIETGDLWERWLYGVDNESSCQIVCKSLTRRPFALMLS